MVRRIGFVIFAIATVALVVLAIPGFEIRDAGLARQVNAEDTGWQSAYGQYACTLEDVPCTAEQMGTVEAIHIVQLAAIVPIACLAAFAHFDRRRLRDYAGDALILGGTLGTMLVPIIRYGFLAAIPATIIATLVIDRHFRDRNDHPGPVAVFAFCIIKPIVVGAGLAPTFAALKPALRGMAVAPVAALVGGVVLAVPIALGLLPLAVKR